MPNNATPVSGSIGIPVPFDFTNKQQVSGDLTLEQMQSSIEYVQSIFIDNRANAQPFTIQFSGLQYTIQVKPGRQGIWPVLAAIGALQFTAVSAGGVVVPTIMFNAVMPYFFWDV
jgi:hypothetical protein